jgi:hypothetical protein
VFAGAGGPDDLLLHEGQNVRFELADVHRFTTGVVMLSFRRP